jgi:hypothetical protein
VPGPALANGSIAGRVRADGAPAVSAVVIIRELRLGAEVDEQGHYVIHDVPAGRRRVLARLVGYDVATDSTLVVDDSVVTLDFTLRPVGGLEVRGQRPPKLAPPAGWHPARPPRKELLERMRRASDVRLVRLTGEWIGEGARDFIDYRDYRLAWSRRLVDRALRRRLVDLLAREESFDTGRGWEVKKCATRHGVAVRFLDRAGEVDVLLCYECASLWIAAGDEHLAGDFDRTEADFARWVKDAIPDDPAIQALPGR